MSYLYQQRPSAVEVHVSVRFELAEMAHWPPDKLAALFGGIAKVVAAATAPTKGGIT